MTVAALVDSTDTGRVVITDVSMGQLSPGDLGACSRPMKSHWDQKKFKVVRVFFINVLSPGLCSSWGNMLSKHRPVGWKENTCKG